MNDSAPRFDRRNFLIGSTLIGGTIAAGVVIGVYVGPHRFGGAATDADGSGATLQPNAFVRVAPDDTVTIVIGKSEMGQGIYTGLPMILAEELDYDPARVKVEFAPVDPAFNVPFAPVQFTGGSMSTSTTYQQLREAGARARAMLLAAAAAHWNVDAGTLRTDDGKVLDGSKSLTYGQLADAASKLPVPANAPLKDPAMFRWLGKPMKRLDTPLKVDGSAKFGLDMRVPGMLFAVVARPPIVGATLRNVDDTAARAVVGVVDVKTVPSGVAVYATNTWAAKQGREALKIEWDGGKNAAFSTEQQRRDYQALLRKPGNVAAGGRGNVNAALAKAAKRIDVEYELPYLAHSPMEPLNCLADVRPDGVDLYTGTQMQSPDRDAVAKALGVDPQTVKVHTAFLGGGFGRRAQRWSDVSVEAAQVSKAIGRPVLTTMTREDDVRGLSYRPMVMSRVRAGIDASGMPVAWQQSIISQGVLRTGPFEGFIPKGQAYDQSSVEGAADMPYGIPNLSVDTLEGSAPIPVLWWRSVGNSHTGFTVNSALDELAALGGQDPVEMRRKLLAEKPRHLAVLNAVAELAKWSAGAPPGRGRGVALHESFGSIVAEIAEVSVDGTDVKVHNVWCAIDCGFAANPSGVIAQMESGIIYGLSAALHGEITFADGKVVQSNFHDYPVVRINETPQIHVTIVNSGAHLGGAGEPGTPPIAPAVTNAIFAATGRRVRKLPISKNMVPGEESGEKRSG